MSGEGSNPTRVPLPHQLRDLDFSSLYPSMLAPMMNYSSIGDYYEKHVMLHGDLCLGCKLLRGTSFCSRCKKARYCSKTCQKSDWMKHKPHCRSPEEIAAERETIRIAHEERMQAYLRNHRNAVEARIRQNTLWNMKVEAIKRWKEIPGINLMDIFHALDTISGVSEEYASVYAAMSRRQRYLLLLRHPFHFDDVMGASDRFLIGSMDVFRDARVRRQEEDPPMFTYENLKLKDIDSCCTFHMMLNVQCIATITDPDAKDGLRYQVHRCRNPAYSWPHTRGVKTIFNENDVIRDLIHPGYEKLPLMTTWVHAEGCTKDLVIFNGHRNYCTNTVMMPLPLKKLL